MLKISSICSKLNNYTKAIYNKNPIKKNIAFSSRCEDSYCRSTRCVALPQEPIEIIDGLYPEEYITKIGNKTYLKDSYVIIHLQSGGMGEGKRAVRNVLRQSLVNPKTNGRILLHAEIIDGKTSPAGFYYKLGFRFRNNDEYNKTMADWLRTSGRRETAPKLTGGMYLPRENVQHCLYY